MPGENILFLLWLRSCGGLAKKNELQLQCKISHLLILLHSDVQQIHTNTSWLAVGMWILGSYFKGHQSLKCRGSVSKINLCRKKKVQLSSCTTYSTKCYQHLSAFGILTYLTNHSDLCFDDFIYFFNRNSGRTHFSSTGRYRSESVLEKV